MVVRKSRHRMRKLAIGVNPPQFVDLPARPWPAFERYGEQFGLDRKTGLVGGGRAERPERSAFSAVDPAPQFLADFTLQSVDRGFSGIRLAAWKHESVGVYLSDQKHLAPAIESDGRNDSNHRALLRDHGPSRSPILKNKSIATSAMRTKLDTCSASNKPNLDGLSARMREVR